MNRCNVLFILSISLAIINSNCQKQTSSNPFAGIDTINPVNGGTAVIGFLADPDALCEFASGDASASDIMSQMLYHSLTKLDENLQLKPDLATRWEFSSDSLQITYYLRHDIKWHDGVTVSAYDVKYTVDVEKDPATGYTNLQGYRFLDSCVVIDSFTVRFCYNTAYLDMLLDSGIMPMPKHKLEMIPNSEMLGTPYNRNPLGNGPFKFKRWKPGEFLEFEANLDDPDGRPYLDRVFFKIIPDEIGRNLSLKIGEIDFLQSVNPIEIETIRSKHPNIQLHIYDSRTYGYIGWNLRSPFFENRAVREALTLAIDRASICEAIYFGYAEIATGPVLKHTPWVFDDTIKPYPYDVERAKAILDSVGWVDSNGNGIRDKDGREFEFVIKTNQGNQRRMDCAVMIQDQLGKIGIKVIPQYIEWTVFLQQTEDKEFDAYILGWVMGFTNDPTSLFGCAAIEERYNMVSYCNHTLDSIVDKAMRTLDLQIARDLWWQYQEIIVRDIPYTFLYIPLEIEGSNKRLRNVKSDVRSPFSNIREWWIPKELQ